MRTAARQSESKFLRHSAALCDRTLLHPHTYLYIHTHTAVYSSERHPARIECFQGKSDFSTSPQHAARHRCSPDQTPIRTIPAPTDNFTLSSTKGSSNEHRTSDFLLQTRPSVLRNDTKHCYSVTENQSKARWLANPQPTECCTPRQHTSRQRTSGTPTSSEQCSELWKSNVPAPKYKYSRRTSATAYRRYVSGLHATVIVNEIEYSSTLATTDWHPGWGSYNDAREAVAGEVLRVLGAIPDDEYDE
ncbi:hypothetical protein Dda_7894 [Drechslerella dactyloides]|uniref:Uncharacterized protein n=1 Tax=Drechslerella dactyloides TaxID=74499 RepID=A0AAD6IUJ9_DREDA|nr:hypothetical protein Dda_7894 [Drechslerella dactyloides]